MTTSLLAAPAAEIPLGRPPRLAFRALLVALVVIALLIPFVSAPYAVQNYTRILIVALPVIGLNMLTGYGGVISLGQSAFFGLGAYVTAILVGDHGWTWWQTTPFAVALAAAAGMLIGVPSLRIRGVYLAIITLVIAAFFPSIIMRFNETTGGNQGKALDIMQAPAWAGLEPDQFGYLVCLVFMLLGMLLMRNLVRGRTGRALVAMRDNETAAAMMGVEIARTKILVFGVSAALAGLAGSLYSATQGIVSSETAYVTLTGSIQFLAAMVIGGSATVLGPLVGAAITERLPVLLSNVDAQLAPAVYGLLLIVVVLAMPTGLVGFIGRLITKLSRRRVPASTSHPPQHTGVSDVDASQ